MAKKTGLDPFLRACDAQEDDWILKKKEYEKLKERYKSLAESSSENVPSPISKVGFLRATIPRVEKVMVLLGDNWFAERTVPQAIEIAERRIRYFDSCLQTLAAERALALGSVKGSENENRLAGDEQKSHLTNGSASKVLKDDWQPKAKNQPRVAHKPKTASIDPKSVGENEKPAGRLIPLSKEKESQVEIREELLPQDMKNDWRMRLKGEKRIAHKPKSKGEEASNNPTISSDTPVDLKSTIDQQLAKLRLKTDLDSDDDDDSSEMDCSPLRRPPARDPSPRKISESFVPSSTRRKSVTWAPGTMDPAASRNIVLDDPEFNGCFPQSILKKRPAEIPVDWSDQSLQPPPEPKIVESSVAAFNGHIEEREPKTIEISEPPKHSRPTSRFKQSRMKKS